MFDSNRRGCRCYSCLLTTRVVLALLCIASRQRPIATSLDRRTALRIRVLQSRRNFLRLVIDIRLRDGRLRAVLFLTKSGRINALAAKPLTAGVSAARLSSWIGLVQRIITDVCVDLFIMSTLRSSGYLTFWWFSCSLSLFSGVKSKYCVSESPAADARRRASNKTRAQVTTNQSAISVNTSGIQ